MRFKLLSQYLFLNTVNKINSIFHSLPLEKEINFYFSTSCFLLDCPYFSPSMMELPNQTTLFNSLTIYLMCSHYQGRITSPTDKISIRPPKLLKTDKRCARKRGRKSYFPLECTLSTCLSPQQKAWTHHRPLHVSTILHIRGYSLGSCKWAIFHLLFINKHISDAQICSVS